MRLAIGLICLASGSLYSAEVTRTIDGFAQAAWSVPSWSPAKPSLARAEDALRMEVPFGGTGFQWCGVNPVQPLGIPGRTSRITLRCKGDARYPLQVAFTDGWGRSKVNNTELKWEFTPTGAWQEMVFTVPKEWVQPISITQVTTHNYASQQQLATAIILLRDLVATTDTSDADPVTGRPADWKPAADKPDFIPPPIPLTINTLTSTQRNHVFAGVAPQFSVTVGSWRPDSSEATLTWQASDERGATVGRATEKITLTHTTTRELAVPAPRFGTYRLELQLALGTGKVQTIAAAYASVPTPLTLTAVEHAQSPYGLCTHGVRGLAPDTFALAGIRWFRDYSFNWEWIERSKGADHSYTGWPNHRAIADAYTTRGLGYLPILADSIPKPAKGAAANSTPLPDNVWKDKLAAVVGAFPAITHWELDNEYDLHFATQEQQNDWQHYRGTHRVFGDTLKTLAGGKLVAVENGRAGIFPDLVEKAVKAGDFAGIDVINCHYYCGSEAPETTISNRNTSFSDGFASRQPPTLFADLLRQTVTAAAGDGRKRQTWLTEFGWDDLAGPRVSTATKTAYLPRGFIAALSAGIDKAFWFYDYSTAADKAVNFFDGCGLLDHREQPTPAFAAMAGLAQVLPAPHWVGPIAVGDSIAGAVLRSRDSLVAALWTPDGIPRTLTIAAREQRDLYANFLPAGPVTLGMEPIYALDLPATSPLLREAAIDIASLRVVQVAAGETLSIRVSATANSAAAKPWAVRAEAPPGWLATQPANQLAHTGNQPAVAEITLTLSTTAVSGETRIRITADDGAGAPVVRTVRVLVTSPVVLESPVLGERGLRIRMLNRSTKPQTGSISYTLPAGWQGPLGGTPVATLAPGELRTLEVPFTAKPLAGAQVATAALRVTGFPIVTQSILAPERHLPRAPKLRFDGDLSDWPATAFIPTGALGQTATGADVRLAAAWSTEGLAVAVEARDAGRITGAPKNFWEGDALEVFIAADGERAKRSWRATDLHFWLVPQPLEGRAFLGRWGHGDKLPATAYDLPGLISKVRATPDGYVLEALIPAAELTGWAPAPGTRISANLNLSVRGAAGERALYWPASKADGPQWQAGLWGTWICEK